MGAKLPTFPSTLEDISHRSGFREEELLPILEGMADKGVVMDLIHPDSGRLYYSLSPPVVGFLDLTMMKLGTQQVSKRQLAQAVAVYAGNSDVFVREVHGSGETALGRALAYETFLNKESMPEIYDWDRAVAILQEARFIAVSNCYCRHSAEHRGTHCSAPMEVCLSLNEFGEYVIRRNFGRAVELSEAMAILESCRKHGLVHVVDNVKSKPAWLCNCCSCCCGMMKAIRKWQFPAVNPSGLAPYQEREDCLGCSRCVRKCPVDAVSVTLNSEKLQHYVVRFDDKLCIGCCVCASVCSKQVIGMAPRESRTYVPEHSVELLVHRVLERNKLGEMILEYGEQWGSPFIEEVLRTIEKLEPRKRGLMKQQLQSRFMNYLFD